MARLVATATLLLCSSITTNSATAKSAGQCTANDRSGCTAPQTHSQCALYLAPSTLPHAGLGLFSGTNIPLDESINEYIGGTYPGYDDEIHSPLWTDLFVPLGDPHYKALPYRGQQRFPSWLGYIWPESPSSLAELEDTFVFSFPAVPSHVWDFDRGLNDADGIEFYMDDLNQAMFELYPDFEPSQKVSAFVPGLASLANNGHGMLANMDRVYENSRADYNGQEAPWHPGAGAFTPHTGVEFAAVREVKEGMELKHLSLVWQLSIPR